ncbi:MAG TPA: class I SAM-dependent methyltransferase [Anaerolineaceae bacterium]|nr:class I SAM-dependent methyltransferase [Anaerolineaceae bacterium]
MLTVEEWHNRFRQQARWTEPVRRFLFQQAGLLHAHNLLEIGCGSGAILIELATQTIAPIYGIDLKPDFLKWALSTKAGFRLACADAFHLPFESQSFSFTFCHYFLMWVVNPVQVISEMKRVTKNGGYVLACAEPDYGGRIDYPESLKSLGLLQKKSLQNQGADPEMGRKVSGFFTEAGLQKVQTGILGGEWGEPLDPAELESEWKILESDLQGMLPSEELLRLKQIDLEAWQNGTRILFVPTFYTWGKVENY